LLGFFGLCYAVAFFFGDSRHAQDFVGNVSMKISSRLQGLGGLWWVMVGLWLGLVPLTSMARIDIRVTQSGSQVNMTLTGSAKTGSLSFKPFVYGYEKGIVNRGILGACRTFVSRLVK
jgi:hypothetical protein